MAKIHGLNVKTDALLQRAEAPLWADAPPDDCGADGTFALAALAPNLGTLPSPPSHLDLRMDRRQDEQSARTYGDLRTYPI